MAPPGRRPSLYVVNPAARALEENVFVGCGKDGMWWFWWSWAERIAVADDVDQAASTIVRVLASLVPKDRLNAKGSPAGMDLWAITAVELSRLIRVLDVSVPVLLA